MQSNNPVAFFKMARGVLLGESSRLVVGSTGRSRHLPAKNSLHPRTIHEQASFSLAVPGPLGGGRAFLFTATKPRPAFTLRLPWFPRIPCIFHGFAAYPCLFPATRNHCAPRNC